MISLLLFLIGFVSLNVLALIWDHNFGEILDIPTSNIETGEKRFRGVSGGERSELMGLLSSPRDPPNTGLRDTDLNSINLSKDCFYSSYILSFVSLPIFPVIYLSFYYWYKNLHDLKVLPSVICVTLFFSQFVVYFFIFGGFKIWIYFTFLYIKSLKIFFNGFFPLFLF